MKVYFQKLPNGDWICYDRENTTGDLYVDPLKIELLFEQVKHPNGWVIPGGAQGTWVTIGQLIKYDLVGFGTAEFFSHTTVVDGVIRKHTLMAGHESEEVGTSDSQFVLELEALPAFDNYVYPDDEEVLDDDSSKS